MIQKLFRDYNTPPSSGTGMAKQPSGDGLRAPGTHREASRDANVREIVSMLQNPYYDLGHLFDFIANTTHAHSDMDSGISLGNCLLSQECSLFSIAHQ